MIKASVDALTDETKKDREAVFQAIGDGVETYIATLLAQLIITIPPTPGLGLTTTPGNPTGPGAIAILPPGRFS